MNADVRKKIELFADNRRKVHKAFNWDWDMMSVVSGLVFAEADMEADTDRMKECEKILKKKTSVFSVFRNTDSLLMLSKMAISDDPEKYLDIIIELYNKISRGKIFDDSYMVLAAILLYDQNRVEDADALIEKYKDIMKRMSKEHPILTSGEDKPLAMMLAMTDKDVDTIIKEMEECYSYMKKNFKGYSDPIQGLSQVLTVTDGDMIEKCDKVIDIYNRFKDRGVKYGREYEFTSLGALIGLEVDKDVLIDDILEADALLASYKGFGSWNMDKSTRLMFAAILTAQEYERNSTSMYATAIGSSLAIVVAEEIAMMIVIIMCATAANNN